MAAPRNPAKPRSRHRRGPGSSPVSALLDLPAGGSLSLHYAPASGGSVTLTYWEVWL